MRRLEARARIDRALMALSIIGAALVLRLVPACGFRSLTGHPCPMCGGTRSVGCLFAGDLEGAWGWNASAIIWVLAGGGLACAWALQAAVGAAPVYPNWWRRACWISALALCAATLGAWFARLSGLAFPWPEGG